MRWGICIHNYKSCNHGNFSLVSRCPHPSPHVVFIDPSSTPLNQRSKIIAVHPFFYLLLFLHPSHLVFSPPFFTSCSAPSPSTPVFSFLLSLPLFVSPHVTSRFLYSLLYLLLLLRPLPLKYCFSFLLSFPLVSPPLTCCCSSPSFFTSCYLSAPSP